MVLHTAIVQAAFEYGGANGVMTELTRVSRDVTRFVGDHWIVLAIAVVVVFLMTRGFRTPG